MTAGWSSFCPISSSRRNRSWKTMSLAYWRCGTLSATVWPSSRSFARKIVAMPLRAMTSRRWYWSRVWSGARSAKSDAIYRARGPSGKRPRLAAEAPPRARCRRRAVGDAGDLGADVVLAAFLPGTPYERVTCRFGRMGREHFGKLGLGEEAVDAVAA